MSNHPITLPPELVQCFLRSNPVTPTGMTYEQFIATRFAQWGADVELEKCCEWVSKYLPYLGDFPMPEDKLRTARRPEPPRSLKEQALEELENMVKSAKDFGFGGTDPTAIRQALESL